MYKSPQESYIKTELIHVATEFNKQKFRNIDSIKAHLYTCKSVCNTFEVDDEDLHVIGDNTFGIQHTKVCCGYL